MKGIKLFFTSMMLVSCGCFLFCSCSAEGESETGTANSQARDCLNGFRSNYRNVMDADLRPEDNAGNGSQKVKPSRVNADTVSVFLEIPDDYSQEEKVMLEHRLA